MSDKIWEELQVKLPSSDSEADVNQRNSYWAAIDVNGNGYLSLAEVDKGLRDVIKIPELFNLKPVIMRAFQVAKNQLKAKNPHGDDYVSKAEFKYLLIYLRQYYEYWTAFSAVDTSNDRRVSKDEFKYAAPILAKWGVPVQEPDAIFKEIDSNNGGFILFDEFCTWAIKKHFDAHHP
jgi:Ca2+-binding EF-hand superfamily protein